PAQSTWSRWSPATGDLSTLSNDTSGNVYEAIGSDQGLSMVAKWPWTSSTQVLESWDVSAAAKRASVDVDAWAQAYLMSSRIDPIKHRAVFLAFDPDFNEILMPIDLATAAIGTPVMAPATSYSALSIDPSGRAWLASLMTTDFC